MPMITSNASDEHLVTDFQQTGNTDSLETLIRRYIGKIRALIYPMVLNDADADDLTQEVFILVVRAIGGFQRKSRFSTWLYRIAMNTTNSFLRKKQRIPPATDSDLPTLIDQAPIPPDRLAMLEIDHNISEALASLSPCLRAAINLTAIHGLKAVEAARIAGCSIAVLYWRVYQARRLLRMKLRKQLK